MYNYLMHQRRIVYMLEHCCYNNKISPQLTINQRWWLMRRPNLLMMLLSGVNLPMLMVQLLLQVRGPARQCRRSGPSWGWWLPRPGERHPGGDSRRSTAAAAAARLVVLVPDYAAALFLLMMMRRALVIHYHVLVVVDGGVIATIDAIRWISRDGSRRRRGDDVARRGASAAAAAGGTAADTRAAANHVDNHLANR